MIPQEMIDVLYKVDRKLFSIGYDSDHEIVKQVRSVIDSLASPKQAQLIGASWCNTCNDYADNTCLQKHPNSIDESRISKPENKKQDEQEQLWKQYDDFYYNEYFNNPSRPFLDFVELRKNQFTITRIK